MELNENYSRSVDQKHRSFLNHSRTLATLPTCERTARNTKKSSSTTSVIYFKKNMSSSSMVLYLVSCIPIDIISIISLFTTYHKQILTALRRVCTLTTTTVLTLFLLFLSLPQADPDCALLQPQQY